MIRDSMPRTVAASLVKLVALVELTFLSCCQFLTPGNATPFLSMLQPQRLAYDASQAAVMLKLSILVRKKPQYIVNHGTSLQTGLSGEKGRKQVEVRIGYVNSN